MLSTAFASISGPMVTPSVRPEPTVIFSTRAVTRAVNSSATEACTMNRLAAVQA